MTNSLNVRLLVTKVQKIADWFMLGVHLGVPNEELNKIDQRLSVSHGAVNNRWTGLVDWTGGLDWWTGLVDSLVMHTGVVSH